MNRKGFGVLEVFLIAMALTALACLFSVEQGSDQTQQTEYSDSNSGGRQP